jgi:hypothetical protein
MMMFICVLPSLSFTTTITKKHIPVTKNAHLQIIYLIK